MTIEQAFDQFTGTEDFKNVAKNKDTLGGRYRQYLSRFKKGVLKSGAMVEVLLANGYTIEANKVTGKKK